MGTVIGYCEICGKQFFKYRAYHKYCSNKCREIATEKKQRNYYKKKPVVTKQCKNCGKDFDTNNSKQVYCCSECYKEHLEHNYHKVKERIVKCPICGVGFKTTHANKKYCSKECYLEAKRNREFDDRRGEDIDVRKHEEQ